MPALSGWPANGTDSPGRLAATLPAPVASCTDCGTLQSLPPSSRGSVPSCAVCQSPLEHRAGRDPTLALCFAASSLLLLVPANLLNFLTTSIAGISRESVLASSASAMAGDGFPELGIAIGLFVVVLPLLRFGLLTAVLGALKAGHRPPWLGRAFRWSNNLQTWAMADVFLLGLAVAYSRLETTISVRMGPGALCFIAAGILTLLTRATLDTATVWRAIGPARFVLPAGAPGAATTAQAPAAAGPPAADTLPLLSCGGCELLLPAAMEGSRCPRCASTLQARKPGSLRRCAALALAAALLYVPANLYPMASLPIGFSTVQYTVLEGVIDLFDAGLWALALLVLVASFVVPLLKLGALAWFMASVLRRSSRRLVARTRLYRVVDEIGRWSMVDPFVIACFVPVTQYNALVSGSAEPAAPVFAAVVILTTLAAHSFDPRLMWDAAVRRTTQ